MTRSQWSNSSFAFWRSNCSTRQHRPTPLSTEFGNSHLHLHCHGIIIASASSKSFAQLEDSPLRLGQIRCFVACRGPCHVLACLGGHGVLSQFMLILCKMVQTRPNRPNQSVGMFWNVLECFGIGKWKKVKEVNELAVFLQSVEGLNPWSKDSRRVERVLCPFRPALVSAAFGS